MARRKKPIKSSGHKRKKSLKSPSSKIPAKRLLFTFTSVIILFIIVISLLIQKNLSNRSRAQIPFPPPGIGSIRLPTLPPLNQIGRELPTLPPVNIGEIFESPIPTINLPIEREENILPTVVISIGRDGSAPKLPQEIPVKKIFGIKEFIIGLIRMVKPNSPAEKPSGPGEKDKVSPPAGGVNCSFTFWGNYGLCKTVEINSTTGETRWVCSKDTDYGRLAGRLSLRKEKTECKDPGYCSDSWCKAWGREIALEEAKNQNAAVDNGDNTNYEYCSVQKGSSCGNTDKKDSQPPVNPPDDQPVYQPQQPKSSPAVQTQGKCHGYIPSIAGGGDYYVDNNSCTVCVTKMGVSAKNCCYECPGGICECPGQPLARPPTQWNCRSNGAYMKSVDC